MAFGWSDTPAYYDPGGAGYERERTIQRNRRSINQTGWGNTPGTSLTSAHQGTTPTGEEIPTDSYRAWNNFIKSNYGMDPQDFLGASQQERYGGYAQTQGIAQTPGEIPLGESGMPDRPPRTPQEAALFQWQAGEQTRQKNEELLNRATAAYQYALGTLRQGGPGSLYEATQPIIGQMAQTLNTSEYTEPDFSFWLTPQAYGG